TNISTTNVTINSVAASCGCTTPKVPPLPWTLEAGQGGEIGAAMTIAGKPAGSIVKTLTVTTDQGIKVLFVRSNIPQPPATMNREENQKLALADRQAVFKGDCAKCHVEKGAGKTGGE